MSRKYVKIKKTRHFLCHFSTGMRQLSMMVDRRTLFKAVRVILLLLLSAHLTLADSSESWEETEAFACTKRSWDGYEPQLDFSCFGHDAFGQPLVVQIQWDESFFGRGQCRWWCCRDDDTDCTVPLSRSQWDSHWQELEDCNGQRACSVPASRVRCGMHRRAMTDYEVVAYRCVPPGYIHVTANSIINATELIEPLSPQGIHDDDDDHDDDYDDDDDDDDDFNTGALILVLVAASVVLLLTLIVITYVCYRRRSRRIMAQRKGPAKATTNETLSHLSKRSLAAQNIYDSPTSLVPMPPPYSSPKMTRKQDSEFYPPPLPPLRTIYEPSQAADDALKGEQPPPYYSPFQSRVHPLRSEKEGQVAGAGEAGIVYDNEIPSDAKSRDAQGDGGATATAAADRHRDMYQTIPVANHM